MKVKNINHFVIHNRRNIYYRNALKREIQYMKLTGNEGSVNEKESFSVTGHQKINSYRNKKIFGIISTDRYAWYPEILNSRLDKRNSNIGLTLGSGNGTHAILLQKLGFVKKWDSVDLVLPQKDKLVKNSDNDFLKGDLNFLKLPPNKYDLILCISVLHHIVNLEHLIFQINQSLKPDGILLIYEFIGENKWQWFPQKIDLIRNNIPSYIEKSNIKINSLKEMGYKPFESIRSFDIPDILEYYFPNQFRIFEAKWNHILYPFLNVVKPNRFLPNYGLVEELIELSIKLEKSFNYNDPSFLPTELIGLYKKNVFATQIKESMAWSNNEIKFRLQPKSNIYYQLIKDIVPQKIRNIIKAI